MSWSELIPSLQFEKVQQDREIAHEYRHKLLRGFSQAVIQEKQKKKINIFLLYAKKIQHLKSIMQGK